MDFQQDIIADMKIITMVHSSRKLASITSVRIKGYGGLKQAL
jgi:hypothetical protein